MKINKTVCDICSAKRNPLGIVDAPCSLEIDDYVPIVKYTEGEGFRIDEDKSELALEIREQKRERKCPYKLEHMVFEDNEDKTK